MAQLLSPQESRRRKGRGKYGERGLVQLLKEKGYNARRSAASGIGRMYPDVEATWSGPNRESLYLAIEVKTGHTKYIRVKRQQLLKLRDATSFFAGTCIGTMEVVAVRFTKERVNTPWIFYQLKPEDFEKSGLTFRPSDQSSWEP